MKRPKQWATTAVRKKLAPGILSMTHGKCAFCEGPLGTQAYPQIEHYHPKSHYPDQVFRWENLLPICQICNTSKADIDHRGMLFHPELEDPESFFGVHPDTGELRILSAVKGADRVRAEETLRVCSLQRADLAAARAQQYQEDAEWFQTKWSSAGWKLKCNPKRPYKLGLRQILRYRQLTSLLKEDRQLFET
jgi:uncharacterized protein (TIGR02646 family)